MNGAKEWPEGRAPSVVVIGGTGGIGYAIAKYHADRGCKVVITGREQERTAAKAQAKSAATCGASRSTSRSPRRSRPRSPISSTSIGSRSSRSSATTTARANTTSRALDASSRMKLIGYTEVAHTLFPRMGAGASAVLFGGLASERPYPGSTSITTVNGAVSAA